ncbi:hypothetical protein MMC12_008536 [Toensbergia leucococca]|nr:hypothetical protein [Toensbergia leucococca]
MAFTKRTIVTVFYTFLWLNSLVNFFTHGVLSTCPVDGVLWKQLYCQLANVVNIIGPLTTFLVLSESAALSIAIAFVLFCLTPNKSRLTAIIASLALLTASAQLGYWFYQYSHGLEGFVAWLAEDGLAPHSVLEQFQASLLWFYFVAAWILLIGGPLAFVRKTLSQVDWSGSAKSENDEEAEYPAEKTASHPAVIDDSYDVEKQPLILTTTDEVSA